MGWIPIIPQDQRLALLVVLFFVTLVVLFIVTALNQARRDRRR